MAYACARACAETEAEAHAEEEAEADTPHIPGTRQGLFAKSCHKHVSIHFSEIA